MLKNIKIGVFRVLYLKDNFFHKYNILYKNKTIEYDVSYIHTAK